MLIIVVAGYSVLCSPLGSTNIYVIGLRNTEKGSKPTLIDLACTIRSELPSVHPWQFAH